jgi:enoyl-CoA hydratase/carnithine racemase
MENQTFHLSFEQDSALAILTIDQPNSKANVFSRALLGQLSDTIKQLESHRNIKGLICRSGKSGMFIAGADLKELGDGTIAGDRAVDFAREGQGILARLERLPYPTVCIIEGPALGGGMEFALCFDGRIVVDHPKTQLGLPETKLGLIPGWGGTQRLPRLVGLDKALSMMLGGAGATPAQAAAWTEQASTSDDAMKQARSLIEAWYQSAEWQNRRTTKNGPMIQPPQLPEAKRTLEAHRSSAAQLTDLTAHAKRIVIELIDRSMSLDLAAGLEEEARAFAQVAGTSQSKELIAEFFAARTKPKS